MVFNTGADSLKAKALRRDPRFSLCRRRGGAALRLRDDRRRGRTVRRPRRGCCRGRPGSAPATWAQDAAEEFGRRNAVPGELLVRGRITKVIARRRHDRASDADGRAPRSRRSRAGRRRAARHRRRRGRAVRRPRVRSRRRGPGGRRRTAAGRRPSGCTSRVHRGRRDAGQFGEVGADGGDQVGVVALQDLGLADAADRAADQQVVGAGQVRPLAAGERERLGGERGAVAVCARAEAIRTPDESGSGASAGRASATTATEASSIRP